MPIPKGVPKQKHKDCISQTKGKAGARNPYALCNWALTGGPARRAHGIGIIRKSNKR